ncbi:MAG: hypothetical protein OEY44_02415 [Candidatus Peregrinibacteria bacterium]|nr:hypothetical protein [Candidatus Peregrinibacteria bacterium]
MPFGLLVLLLIISNTGYNSATMNLKKKLKHLLNVRLSKKFMLMISPIVLFQVILPVRPFALYLIEDLGVSLDFLAVFESITVPITLLLMSWYVIQILDWSWLRRGSFTVGFVLLPAVFVLFFLLSQVQPPNFLFYSTYPLLFIAYRGWGLFAWLSLTAGVILFVYLPLIGGLVWSAIVYHFKKLMGVQKN